MKKEEAIEIIKYASLMYEMEFTTKKADFWAEMLITKADYKPSMQALEQYIKAGNSFPPKLPNIMRRGPKILKFDVVDEKTKEHRHRMKHDPKYLAEKKRLLDEFKKKLAREAGECHE